MVGNSVHEYDRLGGYVPTYTLTKDRQVVWDVSVTVWHETVQTNIQTDER